VLPRFVGLARLFIAALTLNGCGGGNDSGGPVTPSTTTTSLATNPSSVRVDQSVTLKAAVSTTGSGYPTGTVTFYDGSIVLGSVSLNGLLVAQRPQRRYPFDYSGVWRRFLQR